MRSDFKRTFAFSRWAAAGSLLLAVSLAVGTAVAQESRTWADATGKHKIQGKYKGMDGGKVIILLDTGKEMQIELKKLSSADQKYVKQAQTEEEDNPFKEVTGAEKKPAPKEATEATAGNATESAGDVVKQTPNWSSVMAVPLTPNADGWKFPASGKAPAEMKSRVIATPQKSNFFEAVSGMAVNAANSRVVIGYNTDDPKPTGLTRVVLCDIQKGKTLLALSAPGKLAPLALDDDGNQVLMRRNEWGWGNNDRLELWKLTAGGVRKVLEWFPYGDAKEGQRDVKWARFLDQDRLVTLGGNGKLAVWKIPSAEALYYLPIDGGSRPALSADRKYLAFSTGNQVGVLDTASGEVAALQAMPQMPWPQLCFSPDDSRLACIGHGRIMVWNFADGQVYREVPLTGLNVNPGEMVWAHPQFLLLGKSQLFDIENQVQLWTYNGQDAVDSAGANLVFVVSNGHERPGALVVGGSLPPKFEQTLAKAKEAPDFFVFKSGTTVKLSLDALTDAEEREKVRGWLTKKLKERGCDVGPSGTIELVATTEAGKETEVSYHGFGVSPWRKHKVREFFSKLAFVHQGKTIWQTQQTSVPGFIQLKEGETIDQVLRRSERPSMNVYETVELPKVLIKPLGPGGLGTSQVTIAGVQ